MKRVAFTAVCAGLLVFCAPTAGAVLNQPPRVEGGLYETIQGVPAYGSVRVFDPEGDPVLLELSSDPQKGSVAVDGLSFRYTPYPGMEGTDQFQVRAADCYGNRSADAVVSVRIAKASAAQPYFCDMDRHPYEYSAIRLCEAGIVSGEAIGGKRFFYPDRPLSRGEFLVMLLTARGENPGVCVNTGLENDAELPLWMKPYIQRAKELGIIPESSFDAFTIPTRAEAVVMVRRATAIDDILKVRLDFTDADSIPTWAVESYVSLYAYRMLDDYGRKALPNEALDKGYAASLLWQFAKYAGKELVK